MNAEPMTSDPVIPDPGTSDATDQEAVDVVVDSDAWAEAGLDVADLARTVAAAVAAEIAAPRPGTIAILFADDATLQRLNRDHRGADKPTNVLAFPAAAPHPGERILGDVALAFETVAREAAEAGLALRDRAAHMIAHGCLHLHGYDHQTDAEAEEMETMERRALARLGIADPYGDRDA